MEKQTLAVMAKLLSVLAGAGVRSTDKPKHFLKLMNVDMSHSILRAPLILASLYGSSPKSDIKTSRMILSGIGAFYLAMAATGLSDKKVGGALPSKLTNFDIVYHIGVGATALWLGMRQGRMMKNN
jgi:hypothetical protein